MVERELRHALPFGARCVRRARDTRVARVLREPHRAREHRSFVDRATGRRSACDALDVVSSFVR
jgi:hypothetical protein